MSRHPFAFPCLALLALLASGCAMRSGNGLGEAPAAAELERQGDELLRQGRREAAFMRFAKAVAADPALHSARFKQGRLYAQRGMPAEALAAFQAILAAAPDNLAALEAAGRSALESGAEAEARGYFRRALDANPGRPEPHVYLGVLASRSGDHAAAEAAFRAALERAPGCAEALNGLGLTLLAQGRPEQAAELFVSALRAGAPAQRGSNNLGLALAAAGRQEEALAAFTRAAGEAGGCNNLGLALLAQGRPAAAAALFERATDLSPTYYLKAHRNLERTRLALASLSLAPHDPGQVPAAPAAQVPPGARAAAGIAAHVPVREADLAEAAPAPVAVQLPASVPAAAQLPDPTPAPAPDAAAGERRYAVHLASFREAERARAEAQAADLANRGLAGLVYACAVPDKGTWLRVAVGPFADFAVAGREAERLRADLGLDYARVVRLAPEALPEGR